MTAIHLTFGPELRAYYLDLHAALGEFHDLLCQQAVPHDTDPEARALVNEVMLMLERKVKLLPKPV